MPVIGLVDAAVTEGLATEVEEDIAGTETRARVEQSKKKDRLKG